MIAHEVQSQSSLDLSGPNRAMCIAGRWYVVGNGSITPATSYQDAVNQIEDDEWHDDDR